MHPPHSLVRSSVVATDYYPLLTVTQWEVARQVVHPPHVSLVRSSVVATDYLPGERCLHTRACAVVVTVGNGSVLLRDYLPGEGTSNTIATLLRSFMVCARC